MEGGVDLAGEVQLAREVRSDGGLSRTVESSCKG